MNMEMKKGNSPIESCSLRVRIEPSDAPVVCSPTFKLAGECVPIRDVRKLWNRKSSAFSSRRYHRRGDSHLVFACVLSPTKKP